LQLTAVVTGEEGSKEEEKKKDFYQVYGFSSFFSIGHNSRGVVISIPDAVKKKKKTRDLQMNAYLN
jgi:hypothetical protein